MKTENLNLKDRLSIDFSDVDSYFMTTENKTQFLNSLTQCYQNPLDIFDRVSSINNDIFVYKDTEKNTIKGYLLYSDKKDFSSTINNLATKHIYNGYALINEPYRQTGALKDLLLFATDFYNKKYFDKYEQLLFYAVTSNPIALRGYYKIFSTVRPLQNGKISKDDLFIAEHLKASLFIETENNGHPFTFKTNLPQRYVENVRQTFRQSGLEEMKFLEELNINERSGDRFLFYWTTLT